MENIAKIDYDNFSNPFGMQLCAGPNTNNVQSHKFNGKARANESRESICALLCRVQPRLDTVKEFDNMHGLNTYDYGARQYNPVTARWDRMDPLAHEYYGVSPYVYCLNNPIMLIDKKGEKPGDFFKTINDAAIDFGMCYNDNSIRWNKELSSCIIYVKDSEGNSGFTYTRVNIGDEQQVGIICEPGAKLAATIHSHAAYSDAPDVTNNWFTGMTDQDGQSNNEIRKHSTSGDIGNANKRGVPSYVTTPNGSLKRYDPADGKISIISKDLPSDAKDPNRQNNINTVETKPYKFVDYLIMDDNIKNGILNNNIK